MVLEILVGGALLALQLATALSILSISKKSVGTISSSTAYVFSSLILITMGTAVYIFGNKFFTQQQVSIIGTSYMSIGFIMNAMKIIVIDPKAKESKIESISSNVNEFFGD